MNEKNGGNGRLFATLLVCAGVVWSAYILGNAVVNARSGGTSMRVTGSARQDIKSDFIIWTASIEATAKTRIEAYESIKSAMDKTVAYLKGKGLTDDEIVSKAVSSETLYARQPGDQGYVPENVFREVSGYRLRQQIEVRSNKVDLVDKTSRSVSELLASGVALESYPPQYIYTKIGDVKVEILSKAAQDAKRRAEEIARSSGANLGSVRSARMSPLQITPIYDFSISGEGINDMSSKDKAITAIVTLEFGLK